MSLSRLQGSCLCGAVQYTVEETFSYVVYCHCSDCRKFSGSAFSVVAGARASGFQLIEGDATTVGTYQKSAASRMRFCTKCGSSLYVEKPEHGMIHVRLGGLDSASPVTPQAHVHVSSKAHWHIITDDLPQFPEEPPGDLAVAIAAGKASKGAAPARLGAAETRLDALARNRLVRSNEEVFRACLSLPATYLRSHDTEDRAVTDVCRRDLGGILLASSVQVAGQSVAFYVHPELVDAHKLAGG